MLCEIGLIKSVTYTAMGERQLVLTLATIWMIAICSCGGGGCSQIYVVFYQVRGADLKRAGGFIVDMRGTVHELPFLGLMLPCESSRLNYQVDHPLEDL